MRNRVEMRLRSRGSSSGLGPETKCDRLRIRMGWSAAYTLYDQYERAGVEARSGHARANGRRPTVERGSHLLCMCIIKDCALVGMNIARAGGEIRCCTKGKKGREYIVQASRRSCVPVRADVHDSGLSHPPRSSRLWSSNCRYVFKPPWLGAGGQCEAAADSARPELPAWSRPVAAHHTVR